MSVNLGTSCNVGAGGPPPLARKTLPGPTRAYLAHKCVGLWHHTLVLALATTVYGFTAADIVLDADEVSTRPMDQPPNHLECHTPLFTVINTLQDGVGPAPPPVRVYGFTSSLSN